MPQPKEGGDSTWVCPDCTKQVFGCKICGIKGPLGAPEGKRRRRQHSGVVRADDAVDDDGEAGSSEQDSGDDRFVFLVFTRYYSLCSSSSSSLYCNVSYVWNMSKVFITGPFVSLTRVFHVHIDAFVVLVVLSTLTANSATARMMTHRPPSRRSRLMR